MSGSSLSLWDECKGRPVVKQTWSLWGWMWRPSSCKIDYDIVLDLKPPSAFYIYELLKYFLCIYIYFTFVNGLNYEFMSSFPLNLPHVSYRYIILHWVIKLTPLFFPCFRFRYWDKSYSFHFVGLQWRFILVSPAWWLGLSWISLQSRVWLILILELHIL